MPNMLHVTRGCMKKMTIMGWVALVAGTLAMVTGLATDYWVHRVSDGEHTGIFPCCPTFKCGKLHDSTHVDVFIDVLIPGLIFVIVGGVLSVVHACLTWRREDRTFYPLSYISSAAIGLGGLILLAGAIMFTATLPKDLEMVLIDDCHARDYAVETGFSYELYVTGLVAYLLAAVFIFIGGPKYKSKRVLTQNHFSANNIVVSADMNEVALQTVSGQVEAQTMPSSGQQTTSLTDDTQPDVVTSSESRPRRVHPPLPWLRQTRPRAPRHENEGGCHHDRTRPCQCSVPPAFAQPPPYSEINIDQPPPYSESAP